MDSVTNSKLISRQFFRLLPIQILLAIIPSLNGIISSLFAGNFADPYTMTAIGLYGPVSMLITTVSFVLVSGSQIMCGKYMGRNQIEGTKRIFSLDIKMTFIISVGATILLLAFTAAGGASVFTDEEEGRAALTQYMYGQLPGIVPFMLGSQLFAFLSLENRNKRTMAATITFIVANLLFNCILVAVLKTGTFGVSLSYSLGCCIFLAVQAQYYFTGKAMMKYEKSKAAMKDFTDIMITGYPGALVNFYQTIRGLIVNSLILRYVGSAGLSAFAASGSVLGLFWSIPTGIVAVSRMMMSVAIGEEDRRSLTDVMRVIVYRCIPLMCLISGMVIALGEPLTRMFYRDPSDAVYGMTVMAFRLLPICFPLSIIQMNLICYSQIIGRQGIIHLESALDGVVCVAGFSALLVPSLGMNGVYLANIMNNILCVLLFVVFSYMSKKRFPRSMDDFMVIKDDFGAGEKDRMDLSVRSLQDVTSVSGKVIGFCKAHGIDARRCYFSGLFLEEMAGNVVSHGFTKDRKDHLVDIRVVRKAEDVILRIKDDCVPFDPKDRLSMLDDADPAKNIGIRMVYNSAADVQYQNILGLNVLTIRI